MSQLEKCPKNYIFGLDIGTRSIVGTVGYRENEKKFVVVSQVVMMHETRAMLDGQIHDIEKVTETIRKVKEKLEENIGYKLSDVCIAAAGRVLKTVIVKAEHSFEDDIIIEDEHIRTLELLGIERAYEQLKGDEKEDTLKLYCVGSTVIHYYLNDYMMLSLKGHKGNKISVDMIATFLPDGVIESLYTAVGNAGLEVVNLTLEPIAASEVAIPLNYRLLNIALVDVGAGTSDISITKDGSIIGYGMIPYAGDAFTEEIAKRYLVDFSSAERIKIACMTKKNVTYTDIMGITHKASATEILEGLSDTIQKITGNVAMKIKELNGGNSVSAVFIVGGGGKIPQFAENLAKDLELPTERVAVRGEEVLNDIEFLEDVEKDSTLVTPVGICLSYYEKNNSFIMVSINGKQIKLYNNNKLTVMDATIQIGFPKGSLFPKRGNELIFYVNGEKRMLRGEVGEPAIITINGKKSNFNSAIAEGDVIEVTPSTAGTDAQCKLIDVPEYKRKEIITFYVNGKTVSCPYMTKVNDEIVSDTYSLQTDDKVQFVDYYYVSQLLEFMDMPNPHKIMINQNTADLETRIYDEFVIEFEWDQEEHTLFEVDKEENKIVGNNQEFSVYENDDTELSKVDKAKEDEAIATSSEENLANEEEEYQGIHDIVVVVNGENVTLSGKEKYIFVDILDFYSFDTSVAGGKSVIQKVNGLEATFTTPLHMGDVVELRWEK